MRSVEKAKPPQRAAQDELLDAELEDSFPASDPPQMTQLHTHIGSPHRPERKAKEKMKRHVAKKAVQRR
jgi:hypothetical protein